MGFAFTDMCCVGTGTSIEQSAVICWLCLCSAQGNPVPNRVFILDSDDVLAGSDFLSIFMQRSAVHKPSSFEPGLTIRSLEGKPAQPPEYVVQRQEMQTPTLSERATRRRLEADDVSRQSLQLEGKSGQLPDHDVQRQEVQTPTFLKRATRRRLEADDVSGQSLQLEGKSGQLPEHDAQRQEVQMPTFLERATRRRLEADDVSGQSLQLEGKSGQLLEYVVQRQEVKTPSLSERTASGRTKDRQGEQSNLMERKIAPPVQYLIQRQDFQTSTLSKDEAGERTVAYDPLSTQYTELDTTTPVMSMTDLTTVDYTASTLEGSDMETPYPQTVRPSEERDQPLQVVSVKVSSSIVRHSQSAGDRSSPTSWDSRASTLVTQEQPTITAVQRNHFDVELPESQPTETDIETAASTGVGGDALQSEQKPSNKVERQSKNGKLAHVFRNFHFTPQALRYEAQVRTMAKSENASDNENASQEESKRQPPEALTQLPEEVTQPPQQLTQPSQALTLASQGLTQNSQELLQPSDALAHASQELLLPSERLTQPPSTVPFQYDPQTYPVSYETSVTTATSGSRVQFYRRPPSFSRSADLTRRTERHETGERNYELPEPERTYGRPEQNYEVPEELSVLSNGRVHGVQAQASPSLPLGEDAMKHGYVVEERNNVRRYRVEERTPDGFIVGEYGVVSHDDGGSLRGVRYTADGTINPRLIHAALVKFLSLK